jgi:carbon storage regulator CsrA
MLVLTRHINESIVITLPDGRLVNIKVCEIRRGPEPDRCRIGIECDRSIVVDRAEVREAKIKGETPGHV